MDFIRYILLMTGCFSVSYVLYLLLLKKETNLKILRLYLLISIFISLLVPLNNMQIGIIFSTNINLNNANINPSTTNSALNTTNSIVSAPQPFIVEEDQSAQVNWKLFIKRLYAGVFIIIIGRLFYQFVILSFLYFKSDRIKKDGIIVISNQKYNQVFSFFNLVFVHKNLLNNKSLKDILIHEKIHALQYHSFDLILVELLSAVMWFNPFIWMMRKEIRLVHEYLADEGALNTGMEIIRYKALLINQIAEERLVLISSGFNPVWKPGRQSLIKKRMIMMTKQKFNQQSKLKILALIPLAALLFFGVACVKGQKNDSVIVAVAPEKMNVLYLGVDNPIRIAASGYDPSEIKASVSQGTIRGENGQYIVRPRRFGICSVILSVNGKEISKSDFRVRRLKNPRLIIGGYSSGKISKERILEANGINIVFENEFVIEFEVVEFTLYVMNDGIVSLIKSNSYQFTDEQIEMIKKLEPGSSFSIIHIKCKGPDGEIRDMSSMEFTIKESEE